MGDRSFWIDSVEKVDRKSRVRNNRIKKAIPQNLFSTLSGVFRRRASWPAAAGAPQEPAAVAGAMASTSGQLPAPERPFRLS
jgi:hypothetical protein